MRPCSPITFIPNTYTAADLAREDELVPAEVGMMNDDEQAERYDRERDEEDDNYQPSSQASASSEECSQPQACSQSALDEENMDDDRLTITGVSMDDTEDDQSMGEEDDTEDDQSMGEEDDSNEHGDEFPTTLSGATLRKLAKARDAFYEERTLPARLLAAVRPFTGLSREQLNILFSIVINSPTVRSGADGIGDNLLRGYAEAKWDEATRGQLTPGDDGWFDNFD